MQSASVASQPQLEVNHSAFSRILSHTFRHKMKFQILILAVCVSYAFGRHIRDVEAQPQPEGDHHSTALPVAADPKVEAESKAPEVPVVPAAAEKVAEEPQAEAKPEPEVLKPEQAKSADEPTGQAEATEHQTEKQPGPVAEAVLPGVAEKKEEKPAVEQPKEEHERLESTSAAPAAPVENSESVSEKVEPAVEAELPAKESAAKSSDEHHPATPAEEPAPAVAADKIEEHASPAPAEPAKVEEPKEAASEAPAEHPTTSASSQ